MEVTTEEAETQSIQQNIVKQKVWSNPTQNEKNCLRNFTNVYQGDHKAGASHTQTQGQPPTLEQKSWDREK